ncbi:MAG: hypothetical protein L0387_37440 [Acidobacteria bacterium]|nr:hypothetical protein [Acidobacteriota bacterium]
MKLPKNVREWFREQGRIGAAKRNANLSPERRRELARQAVQSRWAKVKKQANAKSSKRGGK